MSHKTSKSLDDMIVKDKGRYTKVPGLEKIEVQLQGRVLMAVEEAAKLKHLTVPQWIKESLENQLIREGCLPSWWHERQF